MGHPESRKSSSLPGSACSPSIHANAVVGNTSYPLASASFVSPLFTPEQWKAISGLFGNAHIPANRLNGTFDASSWIIDIGATYHVTGKKSCLFDTNNIECTVGLPNGDIVVATLVGSIRLSDKIY